MNTLKKVLVVDDDPVISHSFTRVLAGKGYVVVSAENGAEALKKIANEEYDAVFTDIRMPGEDGIEVARQVRAQRPWMPVVIITGYGSPENEARAEAIGVKGFLHKPLSPKTIEQSVEAVTADLQAAGEAAAPADANPVVEDEKPAKRSVGRVAVLLREEGNVRHCHYQKYGDHEGREEVPRFHFSQIQETDADHENEGTADAGQLVEHEGGHVGLGPDREQGERALVGEDGEGREGDTGAHRACEEHAQESVEHALCQEQRVVSLGAGAEGAEDGHGARTEQHGSGQEAVREVPVILMLRESALQELPEPEYPSLDVEHRADQPADDQGEGKGENMGRGKSHFHAEHEGDHPGGGKYRVFVALGQTLLDQQPEHGADHDGEGVDHGCKHGHSPSSLGSARALTAPERV